MVTVVTLLGVILVIACLHRVFARVARIRVTRADRTGAGWFEIATYAEGRITHATPMRDGVHTEDERGECPCHPKSGVYQLPDGRCGTFYTHHSRSASRHGQTPMRVPRRFRPGWRWPE